MQGCKHEQGNKQTSLVQTSEKGIGLQHLMLNNKSFVVLQLAKLLLLSLTENKVQNLRI